MFKEGPLLPPPLVFCLTYAPGPPGKRSPHMVLDWQNVYSAQQEHSRGMSDLNTALPEQDRELLIRPCDKGWEAILTIYSTMTRVERVFRGVDSYPSKAVEAALEAELKEWRKQP